MANLTSLNLLKVLVFRVLRLDATGALVVGASSRYTADTPISLTYTPVRPDREEFVQPNGAGDECLNYQGPPRGISRVDLSLNLCKWDAQLAELLAGGEVILDGADAVGYLPPIDADVNADGVALETWSIAWNGNQRASYSGDPAFWRHVFPLTTWESGEVTLENGPGNLPLSGRGVVNAEFGTGYAPDPFPVDVSDRPFAWVLDDAAPAAAVGYQAIA